MATGECGGVALEEEVAAPELNVHLESITSGPGYDCPLAGAQAVRRSNTGRDRSSLVSLSTGVLDYCVFYHLFKPSTSVRESTCAPPDSESKQSCWVRTLRCRTFISNKRNYSNVRLLSESAFSIGSEGSPSLLKILDHSFLETGRLLLQLLPRPETAYAISRLDQVLSPDAVHLEYGFQLLCRRRINIQARSRWLLTAPGFRRPILRFWPSLGCATPARFL